MSACKQCNVEILGDTGQLVCDSCLEKQGKLHIVKPIAPVGRCTGLEVAIKDETIVEDPRGLWVIVSSTTPVASLISHCPFCGKKLYDNGRKDH